MPVDSSVQHLVELGYRDPHESSAESRSGREQMAAESRRIDELTRAGRHQEAATAIESLLDRWPENLPLRVRAAQWFRQQRRFSEALRQLDELMYRGVETANVAALRGEVLLALRRIPAAIEQLEYARHLDAHQPQIHLALGQAYARAGRLEEAEGCYEADLELNKESPHALDGLAAIALRRGEFTAAADLALRALDQQMQLATAHYRLGVALLNLGKSEPAIHALQTCAKVDPLILAPFRLLLRLEEDEQMAGEYRREVSRRIQARRQMRRGKAS